MTPVLMSPSGYPLPAAEDDRLAELLAHGLLDGTPPDGLEGVCALARDLFGVPLAFVTIIGRDDQRALAASGADPSVAACDRRSAFCGWTVAGDEVLVVPDATQDPRFAQNPFVTGPTAVRFYAGAPLLVRPGVSLGALCLLDTAPRAFSPQEAERLKLLAAMVVGDLSRRRALIDLARREALVTRAAHLTKIGSWAYDVAVDRMTWSTETCAIVGLPQDRAPSCQALLDCFIEGEPRVWAKQAFRDLLSSGQVMDRELELHGPEHAEPRWVRCLAEAERVDGVVARIVGSVQDVTERREAEARIERLAYRDGLTGLPNRALFQQTVTTAVETAARRGSKVGLLILDLDHFKDVNDSLGHEVGDALLCSVATRLEGAYRKTDMVARLGGDEFAVILPNINGPDDLIRPTAKVMELLRNPLEHDGRTLSITASVGAAIYPEGEDDAAQLLKNADIALFQAKALGRNRIVPYAPEMRYAVERRIAMLREVREGLKNGEFTLHYQPVVDIGAREGDGASTVQGFEALARWNHPSRGLLTPEAFMEAFDDQELSLQLGEATLEGALGQMRAWMDEGLEFGRVAVNVSAAQFRTGRLAATIAEALARWKVPAERLCIEVTENVYMGWGAEVVGDAARELHAMGVQIALDDFGTGYASLTHLKSFPIDRLKIDRSFVQSEADSAIVSAVITLGLGLGMKVIAEGVEDEAQLAFLRKAGCDQAQGYLIGFPMPAADVPGYLAAHAARPPRAKLRLA